MRSAARHLLTIPLMGVLPILASAAAEQAVRAPVSPAESEVWASKAALAALPEAPEKAIVLEYCAVCHSIDWIVRSGGTKEGWADRINRMIRGGATIPRENVSAVAAYLAKALPPRPAPSERHN